MATDNITWLNSAAMADRLGISVRTLFKYQNNGFLIEGRHFQRSTPAPKSPWVWDADLTLKAWNAEVQS